MGIESLEGSESETLGLTSYEAEAVKESLNETVAYYNLII